MNILGSGASAVVYRDGDEAVKRIPLHYGLSKSQLREILILHRLDHPGVVRLNRVEWTDTHCLLRFPLLIKADPTDFGTTMCRLVEALCYLKRLGVLHRDLKPENVLYSDLGAVVVDFGNATFSATKDLVHSDNAYTIWYAAPEVLLGQRYGYAAEIWALACLLVELHTGTPLYQSHPSRSGRYTNKSQLKSITSVSLTELNLPEALRRVIFGMLNHDPKQRSTIEQVSKQLYGEVPKTVVYYYTWKYTSDIIWSKAHYKALNRYISRSAKSGRWRVLFLAAYWLYGISLLGGSVHDLARSCYQMVNMLVSRGPDYSPCKLTKSQCILDLFRMFPPLSSRDDYVLDASLVPYLFDSAWYLDKPLSKPQLPERALVPELYKTIDS